ncbi:POT family proton-dependent oligopeptide transporter [Cytobacillus eiseniae]|uniref:POT family proton-dependent oligopeptide transporter n=1 Tax=Cytobacillus eiseniae TaxID=762947 RepID=A0ABS4RHG8_9BACI|nr:peptide MFS transporter [Cytobacillus eiseniae]MBP2242198.1 POT family proton-dependent oligopeptide transporter [Cytobacillus eiseniae]
MDATMNANQQGKNKKKHPPGLYLLFLTEMWERFSYYGMRAILVLYLTTAFVSGGLGFSDSYAMMLYGFFTGAVYFTPMVGGYLSDRFLGQRRAITIGGVLMALGNIALFMHQSAGALYLGLILLIVGNGFFKPNISTIVGELYEEKDPRRDAAFTIFYMGINIGAFFSPLIIGFLYNDLFKTTTIDGIIQYGFKYGFLASAIGMIIGQLIFNLFGNRYLGDIGKKPTGAPDKSVDPNAKNKPLTKKEKQRTAVIVILACFVVFFWAGFEQAGSSLTLYTERFVDREIFGWEIPTAWFQSVNPVFIVILAPIFSMFWLKLASSKRGDLKVPTKMGLGMILLGLGYVILLIAIAQTGSDESNIQMKANVMFIVLTYLMHTMGELMLSPVGLSLVSRIAPVKLASLLMGVWLASTGVANILAGQLAAFTQTLGYFEIFSVIGLMAIVLGFILLSVSKKLVRMMD